MLLCGTFTDDAEPQKCNEEATPLSIPCCAGTLNDAPTTQLPSWWPAEGLPQNPVPPLASSLMSIGTAHLRCSTLNAKLNGASVRILIDTGASHSFIHASLVHKIGLVVRPISDQPVKLADGSTVTCSACCKARLSVPTHPGTKARYHITTVNAFVLSTTSSNLAGTADVVLGEDWLYANKAVLDFTSEPYSAYFQPPALPADEWLRPSMTGLQVLQYATDRLFYASTVTMMSDKQTRRALRNKHTAASAFTVMVRQAATPEVATSQTPTDFPAGLRTQSPGAEMSSAGGLTPGSGEQASKDGHNPLPDLGTGPVNPSALSDLLTKYAHLFGEPPPGLPPDRELDGPVIPLMSDAIPSFVRGRRLTPAELAEVQTQVKDLLAKGYIQPSQSPWGAPVLFVPKHDGGLRMAIDYRKLNSQTIPNRWPLPRIDDLLDSVRDARVFSLLDLRSGYHQIRLTPEDVPKSAFITPFGLYEFKVLPFGLSNAPAIFVKYMSKVLGPLLGKCVVVYLDDILIFSDTPEQHLVHLEQVFQILSANKLFVKASKCALNRTEIKYVGFIVGHGKLRVDPAKIAAISSWPTPTYPKELQSFLGLANYFCKFMQGYSTVAAPLTTLVAQTAPKTKHAKGEPFGDKWTPAHQSAFDTIKEALCHAPVLTLPDPNKPYRLIADASTIGTGAVLEQDGHPIAYLSHKLSETESRYTVGEQELLAVILALKAWRCYLHGCPGGLTLVTDHHPLTYLQTQLHLSPKQVRWSQFLSQFMPFTWQYIPGRDNVADPLSRHPAFAAPITVQQLPARSPVPPSIGNRIKSACVSDPWLLDPSNISSLIKSPDGFWRGGGEGMHPSKLQIYVPDDASLKSDLLFEFHDAPAAGHPGVARTLELVSRLYWWPGMLIDIQQHVHACDACQRNKASNRQPAPFTPLPIPVRRWDSVSMDLITGLPRCKHFDSIFVVVDRLSKMAIFTPTSTHVTAEKLADLFVTRVVTRFGMPASIVSDRDPRFTSTFWTHTCKLFGTKQKMSSAFHPQTDGQTERMNRLLEETLRHYVNDNQSNWVNLLPMAEFAINNSWNSSIQSTPFYLNFGQHPRLPADPNSDAPVHTTSFASRFHAALGSAKHALAKAHEKMKKINIGTPIAYHVGQQVLLSSKNLAHHPSLSRKLMPKWVGPFTIIDTITKDAQVVAVRLQLPWPIHPTFSTSIVKPYLVGTTPLPPHPDASWFTAEGPSVERLLARKPLRNSHAYLVLWHNTSSPTWENNTLLPLAKYVAKS